MGTSAIRLSAIGAALQDTDGSETLTLNIGAIPVGATLTDGANSFTADQARNANYTLSESGSVVIDFA